MVGPVAWGIRTFNPNGEIPVPHDSADAERATQEPQRDSKQDSKQDLQPRAAMPRILVVDDDPMVCMAIEIHLERHNFQVTVADGGEAGLRALEGMNFDLMIVDIFMPHMRGFESIRIFHERAPSVPLIAMSGYAFANLDTPAPDFLRMALELGATRCLRKPFTPVALLTVINECLADVRSPSATAAQSQ
jgi:CheY-like chemotaxis protein